MDILNDYPLYLSHIYAVFWVDLAPLHGPSQLILSYPSHFIMIQSLFRVFVDIFLRCHCT